MQVIVSQRYVILRFAAKGKKKQFLITFVCRKFQRIAYRYRIYVNLVLNIYTL